MQAELNEQQDAQLGKPPTLATANDVRELVQYLKRRPDGINLCDVPQPIKKRVFCPTKIAAYEYWGLVTRKRDRLTLSSLGWEFSRSLDPEARSYRTIIQNNLLYRAALEWIHREQIELVTKDEVANYWQQAFHSAFDNSDSRLVESAALSFFHLCQAGELGSFTIGKRGYAGRLRIWRAALLQFLNAGSGSTEEAVA